MEFIKSTNKIRQTKHYNNLIEDFTAYTHVYICLITNIDLHSIHSLSKYKYFVISQVI